MKRHATTSAILYRTAKSFKKGSFFYKLLGVILLSTILFSAISLGTMGYVNRIMLERETQAQISYMDYNIKLINGNMAKIYNIIRSMTIDTDITGKLDGYTRLSMDYYEITGIKQIFTKLSTSRLDGNNLVGMFIYVDKDEYVVTDTGVMDASLFFNLRFAENADAWPELMQGRQSMRIEPMDIYYGANTSHSICIVNTLYSKMRKIGALVVAINPAGLSDSSAFADFTRDRPVCLMDESGKVIANLSGHDPSVFSEVPALLGPKRVSRQLDGYLVQAEKTAVAGLYLAVMTPTNLITGSISPVFDLTAVIIGVTFMMGVILSLVLSQRIYRPVLRLLDLLRGIESPSGRVMRSEFDIIERNVAGILKNYEHMERAVVDSTPLLLEAIFKKIIAGERERDTIGALLQELSIDLREGLYLAVAVRVQCPQRAQQEMEYFLSAGLRKLIRRHLDDTVISMFRMADDTLAVILYLQDESALPRVAQRCACMHTGVLDEMEAVTCTIGVGNPYCDPYDIGKSYGNAVQMLDRSRVGSAQTVLVYDPEAGDSAAHDEPVIPNDLENRLFQYIMSGNGRMAMELAQSTLNRNYSLGISLAAYNKLLAALQGYARRIYDAMDESGREAVAFTDLQPADNRDIDWASGVVLGNYGAIAGYYDIAGSADLIGRIIGYIDENLHRDIGLDEIASAVGLTPNYVTRYFRKQKGINFKYYVNAKRIEKAKRLLSETGTMVKNIATLCGFNSSKRFIATFTKFVGATPMEYRRRCMPSNVKWQPQQFKYRRE